MKGRVRYLNSGAGWTAELLFMFAAGFALATMLWLALWFFRAEPTQAAAIQLKESALQECIATKQVCTESKEKLQTANRDISRQLEEALVGWGRCIRSK